MKDHSLRWKCSHRDYMRMQKIAEEGGFTSQYELCQYIFSCFLRIADPQEEMTMGLEELKDIWHDWQKPEGHFSTITTKDGLKLTTAIYLYENDKGETVGTELIQENGRRKFYTHSITAVLDAVLKLLFPKLALRLMRIGAHIDEQSYMRILYYLATEFTPEHRAEYAQNEYGNVPKRSRI